MPKNTPMLIRNVPETIRKKFRISCLHNNVTMQEVLVKVMNYLADPDKLQRFMEVEEE